MTRFDDRSTAVLFKGPGPRTWIAVVVLLVAFTCFLEFRYPPPPAYKAFGIVVSAGPISVSRHSGGTRQSASVRLIDGSIVLANASLVDPLTDGDGVTLLVHPSRIWMSDYEVIKRNRQ